MYFIHTFLLKTPWGWEREDAECFPCLTCACFVSTGWWRTINLKNQHFAFNIMHNLQSKVIEAQNISWQKVQSSISFAWFIRFWISQSRGMIYPINTPLFYKVYLSWGWLWRGPPSQQIPSIFPMNMQCCINFNGGGGSCSHQSPRQHIILAYNGHGQSRVTWISFKSS